MKPCETCPLLVGCTIAPRLQYNQAIAGKCRSKLYAQYAQLLGDVCLVTPEDTSYSRKGLQTAIGALLVARETQMNRIYLLDSTNVFTGSPNVAG